MKGLYVIAPTTLMLVSFRFTIMLQWFKSYTTLVIYVFGIFGSWVKNRFLTLVSSMKLAGLLSLVISRNSYSSSALNTSLSRGISLSDCRPPSSTGGGFWRAWGSVL